jgi:hypothetical protein
MAAEIKRLRHELEPTACVRQSAEPWRKWNWLSLTLYYKRATLLVVAHPKPVGAPDLQNRLARLDILSSRPPKLGNLHVLVHAGIPVGAQLL